MIIFNCINSQKNLRLKRNSKMMISFNLEFLLKDIIKKYCLKKWILKKQEVEHSLKKLKSLEKEIESNLIKIKIKSKSFLVKVESLEYFQMKLNQIYIS